MRKQIVYSISIDNHRENTNSLHKEIIVTNDRISVSKRDLNAEAAIDFIFRYTGKYPEIWINYAIENDYGETSMTGSANTNNKEIAKSIILNIEQDKFDYNR